MSLWNSSVSLWVQCTPLKLGDYEILLVFPLLPKKIDGSSWKLYSASYKKALCVSDFREEIYESLGNLQDFSCVILRFWEIRALFYFIFFLRDETQIYNLYTLLKKQFDATGLNVSEMSGRILVYSSSWLLESSQEVSVSLNKFNEILKGFKWVPKLVYLEEPHGEPSEYSPRRYQSYKSSEWVLEKYNI